MNVATEKGRTTMTEDRSDEDLGQAVWARPDHRGAARDTGARAVTFLQGSSRTCGWLKTYL